MRILFLALVSFPIQAMPAYAQNLDQSEQVEDQVQITQASAVSSAQVLTASQNSVLRPLSASLAMTGYSDFKETSDNSKNTYSVFEATFGYRLDQKNSFSLYIPLQKDLSQEFEEKFALDAKASHTLKNIYRYGLLDFHHTTSLVYPTTEASKMHDEMYAGLELSPRLDFDFNKYVRSLSFTYIPRYRRRFHKYTSNRSGEYMVNESLLQFFVMSLGLSDRIGFQSTLVYVQSSRYDGARLDDSYLTVQELQYQYNKTVGFNLGVQTGGSIINPERGQAKNIEIFDENLSEFYTGANVVF